MAAGGVRGGVVAMNEAVASGAPLGQLLEAAHFAAGKHRDQRRKDAHASPYINHPLGVAHLLWKEGGVTDLATLQVSERLSSSALPQERAESRAPCRPPSCTTRWRTRPLRRLSWWPYAGRRWQPLCRSAVMTRPCPSGRGRSIK